MSHDAPFGHLALPVPVRSGARPRVQRTFLPVIAQRPQARKRLARVLLRQRNLPSSTLPPAYHSRLPELHWPLPDLLLAL
jgi:hypothetical protein